MRISSVPPNNTTGQLLRQAADSTEQLSSWLKANFKATGDQRALRAELMLEELSEVLQALQDRDELELLDGLADLMYVTVGTGVKFDLPVEDAFQEVHRSNMTKGAAAAAHSGDKGKGEGYSPADLRGVLDSHRGTSHYKSEG